MAIGEGAERVDLHSLLTRYQIRVSDDTELFHSARPLEGTEEYREILEYLSEKGANHRDYRHYATRDRVESILGNSAFFLSDGSNWNDKFDRRRFNREFSGRKRFGICLSCSTEESVAMWMLYGGTDGNGAMIRFDKQTLQRAMTRDDYEFGHFENGAFTSELTLGRDHIDLKLMEVLYFRNQADDRVAVMRSMGSDRQVTISRNALDSIDEITKHVSWSYEQEVRLVASVDKHWFNGRDSHIKCVRIPLELDADFLSKRVYNSPVSDGKTSYRDSELQGTVAWDLCGDCSLKKQPTEATGGATD